MSAYSDLVLLDGALFYWRLGESAGTTAVDQKGVLNGTYTGPQPVVLAQPGALSGSGDTDTSVNFWSGVDGPYMAVAADTRHQGLSNFTVEAWVYPTLAVTTADVGIACHFYVPGNLPLVLAYGYAQGTASATGRRLWGGYFGGAWQYIVDPTDMTLNTWYHAALTYDGTTLRLYRNGVEVVNGARAGWAAAPATATLVIGRQWQNNWAFRGRLDEVALYSTPLSASQILAHYTTGTTLPVGPTVLVGTDNAAVFATL